MIIVNTPANATKNTVLMQRRVDGTWNVWIAGETLPAFMTPAPAEKAAALAVDVKFMQDAAAASQNAKLKSLAAMSPAEVQTWVAANVTNLAQVQDAIGTLAIAVSVLARRL